MEIITAKPRAQRAAAVAALSSIMLAGLGLVAPSAGATLPAGAACTVVGRTAPSIGALPITLPPNATVLTGTPGDDVICLLGFGGVDIDNDGLFVTTGDVPPTALFALSGDDTVYGTPGIDIIFAGSGDDVVKGDAGNDLLFGEEGDDTLNGDGGVDQISGGSGFDTISGGAGNDDLFGDSDNDDIYGDDGSDFILGNEDQDNLYGGKGADEIHGNEDADFISGQAGNDLLLGGHGSDKIHGGMGQDLILGDSEELPASLNCDCSGIQPAPADGPEAYGYAWWIWSTDFNYWGIDESRIDAMDSIHGDGGDDFIDGEIGSDNIQGGEGDDTLWGGLGQDVVSGGQDDDDVHGDEGLWPATYPVTADPNEVAILALLGIIQGAPIPASTISYFKSLDKGDTLRGDEDSDTLDGGPGADSLDGGSEKDTCEPNAGGAVVVNCEVIL